MYDCEECGQVLTSNSRLIQHLLCHRGAIVFCCDECEEVFLSESQLEKHTATLHTNTPKQEPKQVKQETFECDVCGKYFRNYRGLVTHGEMHYGTADYKCQHCEKQFYSKKSLTQHLRVHGKRKFCCELCGGKFKWKGDLTKHLRNIHISDYEFKCTKCGTGFFHKKHLAEHVRNVHGRGSRSRISS